MHLINDEIVLSYFSMCITHVVLISYTSCWLSLASFIINSKLRALLAAAPSSAAPPGPPHAKAGGRRRGIFACKANAVCQPILHANRCLHADLPTDDGTSQWREAEAPHARACKTSCCLIPTPKQKSAAVRKALLALYFSIEINIRNTGVCEKNTPVARPVALQNSSRNSTAAPDVELFKPNFPGVFFSGGVFCSQTPVSCGLGREARVGPPARVAACIRLAASI